MINTDGIRLVRPFIRRLARPLGVRGVAGSMALLLVMVASPQIVTGQNQQQGLHTIFLQYINASTDSTLGAFDFYGDDVPLVTNLESLAAAPFLTTVVGSTHKISVTADTATGPGDPLFEVTVPASDEVAFAIAVLGLQDAEPGHNPDSVDVSLQLSINASAIRNSVKVDTLLVNVLNSATTARSLWVSMNGSEEPIADSLYFAGWSDYAEIPVVDDGEYFYVFLNEFGADQFCGGDLFTPFDGCLQVRKEEILEHGNVFTIVVHDVADDFQTLQGAVAVFPNGVVVPLYYHLSLGLEDDTNESKSDSFLKVYPTPSAEAATITFEADQFTHGKLEVADLTGRTVLEQSVGPVFSGVSASVLVSVSDLPVGLYLLRLSLESQSGTTYRLGRIVVAR